MKPTSITLKRKPKTKRAIETTETIIQTAIQILLKDGLDALNTNAIAERAGVSVGSLYQYYADKDHIIADILDRNIQAKINYVKEAIHIGSMFEPVLDVVDSIVNNIVDKSDENLNRLEAILIPYALTHKNVYLNKKIREGNEMFIPLLEVLLDSKLPSMKKRNLPAVSFFLVQASRAIIIGPALNPDLKLTKDDVKTELKKLIIGYLEIH